MALIINLNEEVLYDATELNVNENSYFEELGIVLEVADGIVTISGLYNVAFGEMIDIIVPGADPVVGIILNIENFQVSAVIFSSDIDIVPGYIVMRKYILMSVPTGGSLLGRIVDPLGNPLDEVGSIANKGFRVIEQVAPSIISRSAVNTPLETGLKVVDSMVPIGHGQRELIIGDTKTGKTSIAIDAILNQRSEDTISIYVAIGQKRSSVVRIAKLLKNRDCLNSTIIVAATASDTAAMQYIAPYSGCAMGEYFMNLGLRVLIIYDDLSKHAVSYRQLSLLLRRPPGREGYPGDVFFLHSRLLERSANLKNGGSITALPIIETIQGDVSAYVPTNVISITDGQIFLETELFSRGVRPAVSPGLSVSRVGSAAQNKLIKNMAGTLKLELAQFREVEGFTKLGLVLDDATKHLVNRGSKLTSLLIQKRYMPLNIYEQILLLYTSLNGYLDGVESSHMNLFESEFLSFFRNSIYYHPLSRALNLVIFPKEIIPYVLTKFMKEFELFLKANYNN
jgi:F-type H+/Na+-transporting ATPase subunit alpha